MSAKNDLQEIYQKQGLDRPVYTAVNLSNIIHRRPLWQAQVQTVDGYNIKSETFSKKKSAEIDAASKCLKIIENHIEKRVQLTSYTCPKNPKIILFMDLENVQNSNKVYITASDAIRIIGFVGKYNRGILKEQEWLESAMELIITDTVCHDAADHALTFFVGLIAGEHINEIQRGEMGPKWVILSSDHFAAVPIEFLHKFGYRDAHSVTNIDDLKKVIPNIKIVARQL